MVSNRWGWSRESSIEKVSERRRKSKKNVHFPLFESPLLELDKKELRIPLLSAHFFFFRPMQILVRVALPSVTAAAREQSSSSSGSDSEAPPSTSSSSSPHSLLLAADLSPSPFSLHAIAERALREAGHPEAHGALASGEWRFALEQQNASAISISPSSSPYSSSSLCLSVAPSSFSLLGGKGGFGSLLRASGRVAKVTDQGACRDLSGRRLKHVEQEKAAAEWVAAAPARAAAAALAMKQAEESKKRAREKLVLEAEASVDAKALREAQERAARETAAAVEEAVKVGSGGGGDGSGEEEGKEDARQETKNDKQKKKKKKKNALDALAGLSGDDSDDDDESSSSSDDE
jgi:hypothetical protein